VKMSFSGSDSEQYSNVEAPGTDGLEGTFAANNGLWCSKRAHATMTLMMLAMVRR
jgi:hypothetical protein